MLYIVNNSGLMDEPLDLSLVDRTNTDSHILRSNGSQVEYVAAWYGDNNPDVLDDLEKLLNLIYKLGADSAN